MRPSVLLSLGIAAAIGPGTTPAAAEVTPLEPGVSIARFDGWSRQSVVVPGRLVSYALPRSPDGARSVVLLVAPEETTTTLPPAATPDDEVNDETERLPPCPAGELEAGIALYRLDAEAPTGLVAMREGLPPDCAALDAADLDGDGTEDLLLGCEGELFLATASGLRTLVRDPGLDGSSLHPRATESPELDGSAVVATTPLGRLMLFGPGDESGEWSRLAEAELPFVGSVNRRAVTVSNPIPQFLGLREDGTLLFATWPEQHGKLRLEVTLIAVSPSGGAETVECWSRLPEPEDVLETHFLMIDDRAMLLVATKPAHKLSLFGEKRLRLFSLERDRSRLGRPPVYAAESRMNLWQESTPVLLDVDGDRREDLVLGYWKGLKDDRVVLDSYARLADGWFSAEAKSTAFDVVPAKRDLGDGEKPRRPEPDRSFLRYGRDLDGDSIPDLLLRTPAGLLAFRGLASAGPEKLVQQTALELPAAEVADAEEIVITNRSEVFEIQALWDAGLPRLVDLDGDGAMEILTVRRGHGELPDLLQIVRLER